MLCVHIEITGFFNPILLVLVFLQALNILPDQSNPFIMDDCSPYFGHMVLSHCGCPLQDILFIELNPGMFIIDTIIQV